MVVDGIGVLMLIAACIRASTDAMILAMGFVIAVWTDWSNSDWKAETVGDPGIGVVAVERGTALGSEPAVVAVAEITDFGCWLPGVV